MTALPVKLRVFSHGLFVKKRSNCGYNICQLGGDALDTNKRIKQLLDERGWTAYRLAKEAGISDATINNLFRRNTLPTIPTLEAVCRVFGITLSQFFAEGDMVEMTPELKELFDDWVNLTIEQKEAVRQMLKAMQHD